MRPESTPVTATLAVFVADLQRLGVELGVAGERLVVSAPKGVIDAGRAAELSRRKAELLAHLRSGALPAAIAHVDRAAPLPLGFVQQRMWLHNQIEPDTVLYNLPAAWRLRGALNVAALERALEGVVARHEVLRSRVQPGAGEPTQTFVAEYRIGLACEDLSAWLPEEREDQLGERLAALRNQRIDLESDAPFRVRLFRCGEREHVLFFMPHHVVWDGWSFDIFLRDLNELYQAESRPGAAAQLPQLAIQYVDYAVWHREWMRSGAVHTQSAHWIDALAGLPDPLDLPCDLPRPRLFSHRGDWEEFFLSAETVERVTRLAAAHRATSFMVLLAAWFVFLHRLGGQRDIVVGAPVQARQVPEVADLIGCFVNTLCLRQRIDPQRPFVELLAAVRQTCLVAYEHQEAPVEMLVDRLVMKRDPSRTPLFQAMFSHQQVSRRPRQLGDLEVSQVHVNPAATPTDLMLAVMEGAAGARGVIHYSTDLFTRDTVRRYRERFEVLLEDLLAAPATPVGDLQVMAPGDRRQLFEAWNATQMDYPRDTALGGFLGERMARTPGLPALRCGDVALTHGELGARVNRLANALRAKGLGRGDLVGLCVERSVGMVVAQLAILASGAAYVPLDPGYPAERLAYMAEDAQLALLVSESSLVGLMPWPRERTLLLDADAEAIAAQPEVAPAADTARDARPGDAAYVIYTSGSTGKPKGVVVPHAAVLNFLTSMAREPGLGAGDRLVAVTTLSFDIAVLELLLPISVGAQVVLASREQVIDGQALRELVESIAPTVMQATPSTWRMLIDAGWQGHPSFKALVGGEGLPLDLAEQLMQRCGELWNMYGPTETTVWSTCWRVEHPERGISIGRPIGNTQVHILDERGHACPVGVPGEISIGGEGVALGYLRRPELTAERFIDDPARPGHRLYRTGDRGRWRVDGLLEHLGRLDFQVKVRGYRIELGEIENNLAAHPQVQHALVIVREDRPGDVRLVAYVVPRGAMPEANVLREQLRRKLPEYMLPQHFVPLQSFPLLPNGKIDRKGLPAPRDFESARTMQPAGELSASERAVAQIWERLLGVEELHPSDNFFDLGGHSLLAMQAVAAMQKELRLRVDVRRLIFESLSQIAATEAELETPAITAEAPPRLGMIGRVMRAMRPSRPT